MTRVLEIPQSSAFYDSLLWKQTALFFRNHPLPPKVAAVAIPIFLILGYVYIRSLLVHPKTPKNASKPSPCTHLPTPSKTPLLGKFLIRKRVFNMLDSATSSEASTPGLQQGSAQGSISVTPLYSRGQRTQFSATPVSANPATPMTSRYTTNLTPMGVTPSPYREASGANTPFLNLSSDTETESPKPPSFEDVVRIWSQNPVIQWIILKARAPEIDWTPLCEKNLPPVETYFIKIVFRILAEYDPEENITAGQIKLLQNEASDYLEGLFQTVQNLNKNTKISPSEEREMNEFLMFCRTLNKFFPKVMEELKTDRTAAITATNCIVNSPPATPEQETHLLKTIMDLQKQIETLKTELEQANNRHKVDEETLQLALEYISRK